MKIYYILFTPPRGGLELVIKQILCYNIMEEFHDCGSGFPTIRRFMQETQL